MHSLILLLATSITTASPWRLHLVTLTSLITRERVSHLKHGDLFFGESGFWIFVSDLFPLIHHWFSHIRSIDIIGPSRVAPYLTFFLVPPVCIFKGLVGPPTSSPPGCSSRGKPKNRFWGAIHHRPNQSCIDPARTRFSDELGRGLVLRFQCQSHLLFCMLIPTPSKIPLNFNYLPLASRRSLFSLSIGGPSPVKSPKRLPLWVLCFLGGVSLAEYHHTPLCVLDCSLFLDSLNILHPCVSTTRLGWGCITP